MDRFDDDTMLAELRELRPKPRPEFTAELDQRAAAGFPRRADPSKSVTPFTLLAEQWRNLAAPAADAGARLRLRGADRGDRSSRDISVGDEVEPGRRRRGRDGSRRRRIGGCRRKNPPPRDPNPPGRPGVTSPRGGSHSNGAGGGKISGETVYTRRSRRSKRRPSRPAAARQRREAEVEGAGAEESAAAEKKPRRRGRRICRAVAKREERASSPT